MKKVDVHLLVKDEVELIEWYLDQFVHWESLGDIVAVDTGSTDGTLDILNAHPRVRLLAADLNMDFAAARNYGLTYCTTEWVLQLDTDERASEGLLAWITTFVEGREAQFWELVELRRENLVGGEPIGEHTYEWHIRLFRVHRRFTGRLHEHLELWIRDARHRAPENLRILHHKTAERQDRQNAFYRQWEEQPRGTS